MCIRLSCARRLAPASLALSALVACAALGSSAHALEINPIVISASRVEQPLSQALSSVSVITRAEIEKSQAPSLADLLQGEAGFEFGRNGGPGTTTSFFLRGQNSTHLAVLIDGARVQVDSIGALQQLDLPLGMIERIEILRGNASALYGDAAVGGVISITTRSGRGQPALYGRQGVGSRNSLESQLGYGGQQGDWRYDLFAGRQRSSGFSAINAQQQPGANPDRDGSTTESVGGKFERRWGENTTVGLRLNAMRASVDTDNAWAASPQDVQQFKKSNQSVAVNWRQALSADWTSQLDVSHAELRYEDFNNGQRLPFYGLFEGRQDAVRWAHTWQATRDSTVLLGIDSAVDRFEVDQGAAYTMRREAQGYFAGLTQRWSPWTLQLNARHDSVNLDYSAPGEARSTRRVSADTALVGLGYALSPRWSLNGSVSSGFRAPTASEVSKNPGLSPETHHSSEVGATYSTEQLLLRVVHFDTRTQDAIVYKPLTGWDYTYESVGRLNNRGQEATLRARWQGYTLKASAVSQNPWNAVAQKPLDRRARHYGSLDVSRPLGEYELGARVYVAGARNDGSRVLDAYSLWSFYASRRIDEQWVARVRLDNAFDKAYQLAWGYNTPGRGVFATLQYSPR